MNIGHYHLDWMQLILVTATMVIIYSFWRAHHRKGFDFNAFDLLMENGRVSKLAFAFMVALLLTTWVIINLCVHDKLTEGYFTTYGTMWVVPIVAKLFAGKNTDTSTETTTKVTEKTTS